MTNFFSTIPTEEKNKENFFANIPLTEEKTKEPKKQNFFDTIPIEQSLTPLQLKGVQIKTPEGRPIYYDENRDPVTEKSITINDPRINQGQPTNIPTVYDGRIVSQDEAIDRVIKAGGNDPITGRKLNAFPSIDEAVKAAQERSIQLGQDIKQVIPEKKQNFFDTIPVSSKEENLAKLEQTLANDPIHNIMSAGGEFIAQMATAMAGSAVGGLSAIGAMVTNKLGLTEADPTEIIHTAEGTFTLESQNPITNTIQRAIAKPIKWWREKASEPVGGFTAETTMPSIGAAAYTATEIIPYYLLGKGIKVTGKAINKIRQFKEPVKTVTDPIKEAVAPIATGSQEAMVASKEYANNIRIADYMRNDIIENMNKNFKPEDFTAMGDAQIAEELAYTKNIPVEKGVDSLPLEQKQTVQALSERLKTVADEAVQLGILKESKDVYFPRKVVETLSETDPELLTRIEKSTGTGIRTKTKHALKRKYETVEETAAAASERLGKEMRVVNDVRVIPIVTNELQKAIAGKKLINQIKDYSKKMGVNTVSDKPSAGFFTLPHPAFKQWRPRLAEVEGKYQIVRDEFGEIIYEPSQIWIHDSFKGPLKSIMSNESGAIMNGFAQLKAKSMSLIMFNPLMHGMVIWGKALPFQPWRTLTLANYREGARLLKGESSEAFVKDALSHNLSPIGNQGWMQRMNDILQPPQLQTGKSVTAKIAGKIAKPFGKEEAAQRVIDVAGHFWHNTLLWEPIKNAQFGMYANLKQKFIDQGMKPDVAGFTAAHMSNRFAGAIPFEDMSRGVRDIANFTLFSRSFTFTNLGVYKDAIKGLPTPVQAQILKLGSELDVKMANSAVKKAATATLAKDITAMYILNALAQDTIQYWQTGDAGQIAKQYADNLATYNRMGEQNPINYFMDLPELTPQALNEPGKEARIFIGTDKYGTAQYLRNPVGKIGEDLQKMATSPMTLINDKLSPNMKFILGTFVNDESINKGYQQSVYNKESTLKDAPETLGKILLLFVETQTPSGFISSVVDVATDQDPTGIEAKKIVAQLAGFSISAGAPGGPVSGYTKDLIQQHKYKIREFMPDAVKQLRLGNNQKAIEIMTHDAGMTEREIMQAINKMYPTLSEKTFKQFSEIADKEQLIKAERMIKRFYGKKANKDDLR